jgi:hypothetical protein
MQNTKSIGKVALLSIVLGTLVVSISLGFLLSFGFRETAFAEEDYSNRIIYIIDKVLASCSLISLLVFFWNKERRLDIFYLQFGLAIDYQLLPAFSRAAGICYRYYPNLSFLWIIALSLSLLFITAYVVVLILFHFSETVFDKSDKEIIPGEKPVESNANYFDEKGHFKGPKQ